MTDNPLLTYWYFHIPNLILAALMYTLLGRFVLGFVFDDRSDNFIWRFFNNLTDPIIRFVTYFTPLAVPPTIILLLAFVWLFAVRSIFYIVLLVLGLAPTLGLTPQ